SRVLVLSLLLAAAQAVELTLNVAPGLAREGWFGASRADTVAAQAVSEVQEHRRQEETMPGEGRERAPVAAADSPSDEGSLDRHVAILAALTLAALALGT